MHARRKLGAPNFRGSCAVAQIEHPNRRLDSTRTIPLHACCCNEKGDVLIKGCFFLFRNDNKRMVCGLDADPTFQHSNYHFLEKHVTYRYY
jgi:hypothetical protein